LKHQRSTFSRGFSDGYDHQSKIEQVVSQPTTRNYFKRICFAIVRVSCPSLYKISSTFRSSSRLLFVAILPTIMSRSTTSLRKSGLQTSLKTLIMPWMSWMLSSANLNLRRATLCRLGMPKKSVIAHICAWSVVFPPEEIPLEQSDSSSLGVGSSSYGIDWSLWHVRASKRSLLLDCSFESFFLPYVDRS